MNRTLVYLMRVYKWKLEYTRHLIRTLPLEDLAELIKETEAQEAVKEYNDKYYLVMAVSALSGIPMDDLLKKPEIENVNGRSQANPEPGNEKFYSLAPKPECHGGDRD